MAVKKIAFPTNNGGLDDNIAERFGRAPRFTVVEVDVETGEVKSVKVVDNPGYSSGSGAGIKAVQKLVDLGVDVVAGPSPGPNAYIALQQTGIKHVSIVGVSVREALNRVLEELRGG